MPLVRPATTTVIILSLIGGLRLFDLIWAMTRGGPGFSSDVLASVIYKQYQAGFYGLSTAGNVDPVPADRAHRRAARLVAQPQADSRHDAAAASSPAAIAPRRGLRDLRGAVPVRRDQRDEDGAGVGQPRLLAARSTGMFWQNLVEVVQDARLHAAARLLQLHHHHRGRDHAARDLRRDGRLRPPAAADRASTPSSTASSCPA